jgi:hypothetical protein
MAFDQPTHTRFDTAFLARALMEYSDRELATFLVRGVALETESAPPDLELCPNFPKAPRLRRTPPRGAPPTLGARARAPQALSL